MAYSLCEFNFRAMGSPCSIRIYTHDNLHAARCFESVTKEVSRLETKFSRYIPGNFFDKINQAAHQGLSIEIDDELALLLDYADMCYQQSDGLFDITSGVMRHIWDFQKHVIPSDESINTQLLKTGWSKVLKNGLHLNFLSEGMELDLGGIVKEYAVDKAAAICREHGITSGVIDLGGDLHVIGPHPDGKPWVIDIRHPRDASIPMATIALYKGGLASSGDYERYFENNGQRYCHIISPVTGKPVSGIAGITVCADQCVVAGSLCTITMLKERSGIKFIDESSVDYVAMDTLGGYFSSNASGLCKIAIPDELSSTDK